MSGQTQPSSQTPNPSQDLDKAANTAQATTQAPTLKDLVSPAVLVLYL